MVWVAYSVMWVASASVIGFAVYFTGSAQPLWALLIPAMISIRSKQGEEAQ